MGTNSSSEAAPRRIGIISGGDRMRYPEAYRNQSIWAKENGYDYRFEIATAEGGIQSHFDITLVLLMQRLREYDWLIWLDDDVYVTDFTHGRLEALLDEAETAGASIIMAEGALEPQGFSSYVNAGTLGVRNDAAALEFLSTALGRDLADVREWWDDERLGIFTGGDQDKITKTLLDDGYERHLLRTTPERFNSRMHLYEDSLHEGLLCHFCGHYDRELSLAQFSERWGLSPDLLPLDVAQRYGLRTEGMPRLERRLRERRREMRGRAKRLLKPALSRVRHLRS